MGLMYTKTACPRKCSCFASPSLEFGPLRRALFCPAFFQIFIKFLGAGVDLGPRGVSKILQNLNCGYGIVLLFVAVMLSEFGGWGYGGVTRLPCQGFSETRCGIIEALVREWFPLE